MGSVLLITLIAALLSGQQAFSDSGRHVSPQQLTSCLNKHQPELQRNSWEHAMSDKASAVPVAGAWWSKRAAAVPLTIVTQLSLDRLGQLKAQCRKWPGPISAALYVALDCSAPDPDAGRAEIPLGSETMDPEGCGMSPQADAALAAAIDEAKRFHKQAESEWPCQLDLLLAFERFDDVKATILYPMNILRNYARLQARTAMVGLFDVDMLPSLSLFQDLSDPNAVDRYLMQTSGIRNGPPSVIVPPAFITFDALSEAGNVSAERISERMVTATKEDLRFMWQHGVINRFDPTERGHNATQYERWLDTTEQYEVKYEFRYEPWVLCDRLTVPWYDARFRGYGQNKIVHLENMNWTGYRFIVHPNAWLIHRKHALAKAKLQHLLDFRDLVKRPGSIASSYDTVYGHSNSLGAKIRSALASSTYTTVVDRPTLACAEKLAWWQQNHWRWQRQRRQRHAAA